MTTYKLQYPFKRTFTGPAGINEEWVHEVTVNRPKAKDMRVVDTAIGDMARSFALIARLTGLTVAEVDELDAYDVSELGNIVEGFTSPGQATGATS